MLCLNVFKKADFSRTYLVNSIMRDHMIKLLNLDFCCDEEALVFDKSNV